MSLAYVNELIAKHGDIEFRGKCHDCGKETVVTCDMVDGELVVDSGAYWRVNDKGYVKCVDCFQKNDKLTNYQPCEVYSRVVGYLRPIRQWNAGKKAEFAMRKLYKNIGEEIA